MRVNIVFLFFTLLGFLLFRGKNNPSLLFTVWNDWLGALVVTEECDAGKIAVTITKNMQHIYYPCSYYPRHISLLIFPSTCLTTTVKQHKSEWTYPIFLDFICWDHFFAGSCHTALRQTRNKFAAPAVSFKRIWHSIPTSTCQRVISSEWLIQTSVMVEAVQKSFQNCSASVKIASSSQSLVSFW